MCCSVNLEIGGYNFANFAWIKKCFYVNAKDNFPSTLVYCSTVCSAFY